MTLSDSNIESFVIGAALYDQHTAKYLINQLSDDNFGQARNRILWKVLSSLYRQCDEKSVSIHIDKYTLASKLKSTGLLDAVGEDYIREIEVLDLDPDRLNGYIEALKEKTIPRMVISLLDAIKIGAVNGDAPASVIGKLQDGIGKIVSAYVDDGIINNKAKISSELAGIVDAMMRSEETERPICFGLPEVDILMNVFHKFCLIMADTNNGKSTMALQVALSTAKMYRDTGSGKKVVFLTLEDEPITIYIKSLASLGNIPARMLDFGRMRDIEGSPLEDRLNNAKKEWDSLPIVVATNVLTPGGICSILKKAHMTGEKVGLMVVDHMQMLQRDRGETGDPNEMFYTEAANSFRQAAIQTDTTILATSQITEHEGVFRPFRARGIDQASQLTLILQPQGTDYTKITCTKNKFGPKGWEVEVVNDLERSRFITHHESYTET